MAKTLAELRFMNEHGVKEMNVYEITCNPQKSYTGNIFKLYFDREVVDVSPLWINTRVGNEFRKDCLKQLKKYAKVFTIPQHYEYAKEDIQRWAPELNIKSVKLPVKRVKSLCQSYKTLEGFKLKDFDPNDFVVAWEFE